VATPRLAKLQLPAADGGPLRVDVRTGARPGEVRPVVAICHGFKGFKDWGMFPKLAERLAVAGFTAVSFNFSGSGVAEGDQFTELERWEHQKPSNDLADIGIVVDHFAAEGASWFALVGHSRGGGLAVLHAASDPRVRSLVTWAGIDSFLRWPAEDIARWRREGKIEVTNTRTGQVLTIGRDALDDLDANADRLDVLAAAGRVRAPWLIINGAADPVVPLDVASSLKNASRASPTELFLVEGGDHTFGVKHPWAGSTPQFDQVLDRTVRWLAGSLDGR
jgi:dienelactone hydrolase